MVFLALTTSWNVTDFLAPWCLVVGAVSSKGTSLVPFWIDQTDVNHLPPVHLPACQSNELRSRPHSQGQDQSPHPNGSELGLLQGAHMKDLVVETATAGPLGVNTVGALKSAFCVNDYLNIRLWSEVCSTAVTRGTTWYCYASTNLNDSLSISQRTSSLLSIIFIGYMYQISHLLIP
jgi:hypothetical protein